jgi:Domain of unknown function (DUF4078)
MLFMGITCRHLLLTLIKFSKSIIAKIKVIHHYFRLTKVEDIHYDPTAEVRSRGVGHYTFSADNTARAEQMAALNTARDETEQQREAAKKASEIRRQKIQERQKEITNRRRKKEAEKFLNRLGLDMEGHE